MRFRAFPSSLSRFSFRGARESEDGKFGVKIPSTDDGSAGGSLVRLNVTVLPC
jgi:hypothetical protein